MRARRKMGLRGQRIFGVLSLLVGLVCLVWLGPRTLERIRATESWVEVPGEVIESRVVQGRSGGRRSSVRYELEIDYRYRFGEQEFTSDRVTRSWNWTFQKPSKAEEARQAYLPGAAIPVFVDPEAPASAVLERGGESAGWAAFGMGAAFLGAGLLILLNVRRQARIQAEEAVAEGLGDIER